MSRARRLSPDELHSLARKLVRTSTPAEQQRLKAQYLAGFYGAIASGRRELMEQEGGCIPSAEAARRFSGASSKTVSNPETARKAAREHRLIAVRDGHGELQFPVWQFREEGGALPGLSDVLKLLKERPGYSEVYPLVFFLQGNGRTEGRPLDALRAGRTADVIAAAQAALD